MIHRRLLVALAMLAPAAAAAQAPAYRRTPGDTLRLHEVTTAELVVRTPQGEVPLASRADAVVALAFLPNDSARAWYESLVLEGTGPRTVEHPPTASVLRQPFALRFDSRGRVETLATPAFSPVLTRVADLRRQFDDFFLRLPAEPLRPGLEWTEAIARGDSAGAAQYARTTGTARYRAERDTTVDGTRGVVVSMRQTLRVESGGPIEGQPITAESVLEGTDVGVFLFAPAEGRILGRTRSGDLRGTVTLRGSGSAPVSMPQSYRYESSIAPARLGAAPAVASALTRFAAPADRFGPACATVAGPARPVVLASTSASSWREMYGMLVSWFGRDEMPLPAEVAQLSSSVYATRPGGEPALHLVAVRFRDARVAADAARIVNERSGAAARQSAWTRDRTTVIVGATPRAPNPCVAAVGAHVAAEMAR